MQESFCGMGKDEHAKVGFHYMYKNRQTFLTETLDMGIIRNCKWEALLGKERSISTLQEFI